MAVDLTALRIARMPPTLLDFGGVQQGALGGAALLGNRMGSRWSFAVTAGTMRADEGLYWATMLTQARQEGAIMRVHQAGLVQGVVGTPTVASDTAAGRSVPVTGLVPGAYIRRQFVTFETEDGRYLDLVREPVIADASGNATLLLSNLLRAPLTAGDAVSIAVPTIAGFITDPIPWANDMDEIETFRFTIVEAE